MKILKKLLLVLLVAFIIIQFFRPEKNIQTTPSPNDLVAHYTVPADVQNVLYKACYDCHSNHTNYPWYANVQPVAWWLDDHIQEGKKELNFSEFAGYRLRRQYHKFEETIEQVKEGEMPLDSYTKLHSEAKLTQQERELLVSWAGNMMESMRAKYPMDSLVAPKK
ncbi:heme-binding domain-containing protein [Aridibaculum aurantiacum]|uniref:heme-binding domain-containing protein n=1 Tax=Aridibaculum aurantiacum TaxID=2810307 RepID=UPI001A970842|nr:heme-binding domain-containing protein [Aridibaculum aurantiacum]